MIDLMEIELLRPEEAFEWPKLAIREKNWLEAARRWAVLRETYPQYPAVWSQAAHAHIECGELEQAHTLLEYACQKFPDHPNGFLQSAELAMRLDKWDEVSHFLHEARQKFPNSMPVWMKSVDYAEYLGDITQAEEYNAEAIRCAEGKNLPWPFVQNAELAMHAEQWEQALERWEVLRKDYSDLPMGYLRAAEAARQLGRFKEARQLTLAWQYGDDIIDNAICEKSSSTSHDKNSHFKGLIELIWTKAKFNLRSEVQRNYLSYGWWLLEPLLHMVVYYVVFGLLLNRGDENYPVFLLTGLIPWMWFMKAVSASSSSILSGQNLMLQVGLPSIFFPLVVIVQTTLKQIPVFILLIGFIWLQGFSPATHWWFLIPVLMVQVLLILVFACAVAAIIPFMRDLIHLVSTGLTFVMFMSGIFYDYRNIPVEWQGLFLLNPMAFILKCYREILIDGVRPDFLALMWWGGGCIIFFLLLLMAYKRLRYTFPRIVME